MRLEPAATSSCRRRPTGECHQVRQPPDFFADSNANPLNRILSPLCLTSFLDEMDRSGWVIFVWCGGVGVARFGG